MAWRERSGAAGRVARKCLQSSGSTWVGGGVVWSVWSRCALAWHCAVAWAERGRERGDGGVAVYAFARRRDGHATTDAKLQTRRADCGTGEM